MPSVSKAKSFSTLSPSMASATAGLYSPFARKVRGVSDKTGVQSGSPRDRRLSISRTAQIMNSISGMTSSKKLALSST